MSCTRRARKEAKQNFISDELTSVNCRGQTPTLSPNLASIQCSSRRLMTVRMSPCEAELRTGRDQKAASVRKGAPQIKWTKGETQVRQCSLKNEHSALKDLSCSINSFYVCRPCPFCSHFTIGIKTKKKNRKKNKKKGVQVCFKWRGQGQGSPYISEILQGR